jgi:hypothetical protein
MFIDNTKLKASSFHFTPPLSQKFDVSCPSVHLNCQVVVFLCFFCHFICSVFVCLACVLAVLKILEERDFKK